MSTLEDKILDGPTIHYCDADNDDIRSETEPGLEKDDSESTTARNDGSTMFMRPDEETASTRHGRGHRRPGYSSNTGPKGVLEDFRKQSAPSIDEKALDEEFDQLLSDDSIIKTLAAKMMDQQLSLPTFGTVLRLRSGTELLDAIDRENKSVSVIVHVYTKYTRSCALVNTCLDELAREFKHTKFVTIDASVAGLSDNFKHNGVPALLAYKNGNFLKSIVQLEDLLDRDFDSKQLKELMIDNSLIMQ